MNNIRIDTSPTTKERVAQIKSRMKYEANHKPVSRHYEKSDRRPLSGLGVFAFLFKAAAALFLSLATVSLFVFDSDGLLIIRFCVLLGGAVSCTFFGLVSEALSKIDKASNE